MCSFYLAIIPQTHVGYEMVDSQRGATCLVGYKVLRGAIITSYPTSASEILFY